MNDLTTTNSDLEVLDGDGQPIDLAYKMREKLADAVEGDFEAIVQAQADLAKGLWIKEWVKDKNGRILEKKVYQQKPDKDAGQYLLNQVIGKPKENMVVAGRVNFILDS